MEVLPSSEVIANLRAALMAALEVIKTNNQETNGYVPIHNKSVIDLGISALNNRTNKTVENLKIFQKDFRRYYNRDAVIERAPDLLIEWLKDEKELYDIYSRSGNGRMIGSDTEPYYGG